MGSLFSITRPQLTDVVATCTANHREHRPDRRSTIRPADLQYDYNVRRDDPAHIGFTAFRASRRSSSAIRPSRALSIGIGVNWVSPFGPLRLDLAKALIKQKGDDTKFFSFNVGTQF